MVVDCGSSGSRVFIYKENGNKFDVVGNDKGFSDDGNKALLADVIESKVTP